MFHAEFSDFNNTFISVLNKKTPRKLKYVRASQQQEYKISSLQKKQTSKKKYTTDKETFVSVFYEVKKEVFS